MQTLASKVRCSSPNIVSSPNPGKEFSCPSNATGCYLNQSNIPPLSLVKVGVVLVTPAWCTPHLELTEVWGMSNRENIGFTSLGTTSFTTTPDPLVQL